MIKVWVSRLSEEVLSLLYITEPAVDQPDLDRQWLDWDKVKDKNTVGLFFRNFLLFGLLRTSPSEKTSPPVLPPEGTSFANLVIIIIFVTYCSPAPL
jgi:hypothetical protein